VWQFGLYLCLLVAAPEFQTVFLQEETISNSLTAIWAHQVSLTPPLFYCSAYSKTGIFVAMYLCTRGIDLAFFYGFSTIIWRGQIVFV
jgi:hypothetical protein